MASGYPGREYYGGAMGLLGGESALYGGGMKRPAAGIDRQQQLQQALFLRSVKQKTLQASPVSPLSLVDLSVVTPAITPPASCSSSQSLLRPPADLPFPTAATSTRTSVVMQNRLRQLEKQLLDDEDEDEPSASVGSAVTNIDWGDEMQQLLSPSPAPPIAAAPSPTTSSSSTTSTASFSPSTSTTTSSSRQLIADTAAAMAEGNMELAASNIAILKRAANPRGDPEQRLTAYMVGALLCRMSPLPPSAHPAPELCTSEHFAATQMLFEHSPVFKLCLSAANLAIIDACKDYTRIHVVDFDVPNLAQYASLIQALVEQNHRANRRPPSLYITAVCDPSSPLNTYNTGGGGAGYLKMVGEKLACSAERVGVRLRFNTVLRRPAEVDRSSLECEQGEALAVNLAFVLSRVADESVSPANPRDELLRRVKALGPTIMTLSEQELNTNTAPLAARAAEACAHYGALLESLDGAAARDSRERAAVEACLGRKAANAVGRDGAERVERSEVHGKWRARMSMAGFKQHQLGPSVIEPVRSRLDLIRSARSQTGFAVKEEAGALWLGWRGRPLAVMSAWR